MDKQEIQNTLYIPQETWDNELGILLINDIIDARKKEGITQKQLEAMSGVKQPIISRMERGNTDPKLSTILKILGSFGKTLHSICKREQRIDMAFLYIKKKPCTGFLFNICIPVNYMALRSFFAIVLNQFFYLFDILFYLYRVFFCI